MNASIEVKQIYQFFGGKKPYEQSDERIHLLYARTIYQMNPLNKQWKKILYCNFIQFNVILHRHHRKSVLCSKQKWNRRWREYCL